LPASSRKDRKENRIKFFLICVLFLSCIIRYTGLCQSQNCEIGWSNSIQVSYDSVLSVQPRIATDGDTIHVLWYGIDTLGTQGTSGVGIQYCHSFDGGISFSLQRTVISTDTALGTGIIAASGKYVCIAAYGFIGGSAGTILMLSSDAGVTWEGARLLLANAVPKLIASVDSSFYIHYADQAKRLNGMLKSSNNGILWSKVTDNMPALTSFQPTEHTLYGVGQVQTERHTEVGYYTSTDSGSSWIFQEIISAEDAVSSLNPRISLNESGTRFVVWNDSGTVVMRRGTGGDPAWGPQITISDEKGAIFTDIAALGGWVSIVWDNDFGGRVGIRNRQSIDGAETFCPVDSPTVSQEAGQPAIRISRGYLHLVWAQNIGGIQQIVYRRGKLTEDTRARSFSLKQNYPNPFNGITHIEYDLLLPSYASLAVYNILGEKVASLTDGYMQPGKYTATLSADKFPSGVYIYRLMTPFFTEVKKLVILK